ncbi:type IIL restriction-modification enzyme MmeI [Microcoleus sp. B9-D4]|uniref:type IIL restriction-modification enzyme MmeI n=1 Tax=Microcoleus sp. B9-D4 TaxID=2818711 RepID=UPI002FCFDCB5
MNEGFKCLKANGSHPETMPPNLRADHATPKKSLLDRNDEILERIYIGRRFKNDTERLEKLFELYTKMTSQQASSKKSAKPKGGK